MGEHSFADVLAAARKGAEWAWAALYREFSPKVLGYLRARNARDPDDLLGEVFLQVVRDLSRFQGDERDFRAWIFTVAHHRMLDDGRYRTRRPEAVPTDGIAEDRAVGNAEEEALDALSSDGVRRLLSELSDDQQTVLLLRLFADMTIPEIAALMGRNVGAVKALQRRGLAALRKALARTGALLQLVVAMGGGA